MPTNKVQPSTKVDEEGSPRKSSLAISNLSCEVVARLRVAEKSVSSHEYFDAVEPIDSEAGSPKPRDHTDNSSSDEYVTASEDEEPPKEKTVCTVEKLDCAKEQADTPREEVQSEGGQPLVQEEQSRVEEEQSRVQEEQSRVQEEQSRVEEQQSHVEEEQPSNSDSQNQEDDEEEEEEPLNYDDFFPPITRSKCGLRGWIFPRGVTQFHIQPEGPHRFHKFHNIMSCGIIHTMWAVAFYVNSLEGGELFRGAICPDGVEWMLRSVIKKGNTAHLENYRPQRFLTAIEAFNVVRRKCKSGMLNWDMESILAPYKALGIDLPKGDQPTGISMEFITPQSDESALAHHVAQLKVEDGDALLYCFSGNFIVFVPTGDGRILLMDEHPHVELKAGAIILVCSRTREDIQDMLNRYYKEHFNSSFNLGQGTKFSFQKY
ncbi:hypothetical protein BSL78_22235 [Apostichopus japonicus]|uniref:Uncharacterized protein n=1 Tax=Stichopus japonicus TaxID=307972 RepID=A0A2G8JYS2_STIJA|nr:hypothetical protein BSL78_22235 [Apostichopus japonicus]